MEGYLKTHIQDITTGLDFSGCYQVTGVDSLVGYINSVKSWALQNPKFNKLLESDQEFKNCEKNLKNAKFDYVIRK